MNKKKLKPSTSSSSSASTINKSQNSSTGAASKSTSENAVVPQPVRRVIQNFLLVWLDANIDASNDDFKTSIQHLQHIVASITTFTNAQECVKFLNDIKNEKIFMIVSGTLGQQIVPKVESWPQIDSIYVFCGNKSVHEQWAKKILKIKGVHTKIEHICEVLKIDRNRCDQAMISVSFNGLDPLFMYTQLLKETLLEIEDDDAKSIKDLVDYCRLHEDIPKDEIKKFQSEYRDHTPIWWYTAETFIYPMLNRGLRIMDIDIILKMGFFIRHLHNHIAELHREQQSNKLAMPSKFQVFRGQAVEARMIRTQTGDLAGLTSNGVDIYLSIRYGQVVRCWSPASLSRFWIGVGNATVFGPVCHPYGPHGQPEIVTLTPITERFILVGKMSSSASANIAVNFCYFESNTSSRIED
ncbi:unnamed protein product [Rotaria sp. Silwood1]|nr:unnamed protein product [Rotaria sp. Silwood1]